MLNQKTATSGHIVTHRSRCWLTYWMGLRGRPHETSYVAAKGHKQYEYFARSLAQITRERTGSIEYMAEATVDNEKDLLTP